MWYMASALAKYGCFSGRFSPEQTVIFRSLRQCRVELPGEGPPLGLGSQPAGDRASGHHRCQRSGERLRKDGPMATSQGDLGAVEVPEGPNYMGHAGFCTMRFYLSIYIYISIYIYSTKFGEFTPKSRFDLTISLVKHRDLCDKNWNRHNGIKSNLYH